MKDKIDNSDVIPEIFEFSYVPFLGPSKLFRFENGEFFPSHNILENNEKIVPTEKQWMRFWEKIDKLGVWEWSEHYIIPEYVYIDGDSWNLKIQLGDKKIEYSGSNAYPGKDGEIVENKITFRRLLLALNKLIGVSTIDIRIES